MTTTFDSPRFGSVTFGPDDILTLTGGLLGFPTVETFLVLEHRPGSHFRWLQAIDQPELAFLVVDPGQLVPDYAPEMKFTDVTQLGLTEETPRLVYTIVTIPRGQPEAMTLNLAGPIVINLETRTGKQVVLDNPGYSVRHSVVDSKQDNKQTQSAHAA